MRDTPPMKSLHRCFCLVSLTTIVSLSSGCVGVLWDMPHDVEMEQPVPLIEKGWGQRWTCQSLAAEAAPIAAADFLTVWGEPAEKIVVEGGERWLYREQQRWCGIWIMLILPLPFELPLCSSYDEVHFRDGVAVHARSRRFGGNAAGILFGGVVWLPIPAPFVSRTGNKHENSSTVLTFPPSDKAEHACPPTIAMPAVPDSNRKEE